MVTQMLVRLSGLIQITLGFLFRTGNALSITPIGLLVGLVLALSLWALALLGVRVSVYPILVIMAVLLGMIIAVLGLTGDWFLCVLASVGTVWQAEELAACIKDVKPQVHPL
jgi:hypothetical protein